MSQTSSQRFPVGSKIRIGQTLVIQDARTEYIGKEFYVERYSEGARWPYRLTTELGGNTFNFLFAESELELTTPEKASTVLFRSLALALGDKVKVIYKPTKAHFDALSDAPYRWQSAMDDKVGQEGRVVQIVDGNSYRVRFDDKSTFTFGPISIQILERAPKSETVKLNSTYNGVVTVEGVVIDDGHRYNFDVFKQLLALIGEQKEAAKVSRPAIQPVLHLTENGDVDLNRISYDILNPQVGDSVKITADLSNNFPGYTTRMARYVGEQYTVANVIPETGMVELSCGYTYPALALTYVSTPIEPKNLRLGHNWTAEVHSTHVQVGCQRYEFDAWERLIPVIEKFEAFKQEFSE